MRHWTLTKTIIAINCVIALWSLALGTENPDNWIKNFLPLYIPDFLAGDWWRIFTCSWVHADLIGLGTLHLLFNMMSLAMLGQIVEGGLGSRHFWLIYFPAGILAALFHLAEAGIRGTFFHQPDFLQISLVGASGCVLGVAAAFGTMHPHHRIMIFPWPFPVRAINAILFFCAVSALLIFLPYLDFIAHSAHLGGAMWGFAYMALLKRKQRTMAAMPSQEEWLKEITRVESMSREELLAEIPFLLRKIQVWGPESLQPREVAILDKARAEGLF